MYQILSQSIRFCRLYIRKHLVCFLLVYSVEGIQRAHTSTRANNSCKTLLSTGIWWFHTRISTQMLVMPHRAIVNKTNPTIPITSKEYICDCFCHFQTFHKNSSTTCYVNMLTDKPTNKQTKAKHILLLGEGDKLVWCRISSTVAQCHAGTYNSQM